MYVMHKFWARKPHNVVAEYIEHYSKPGDIVLDPFCGSGVTAVEAVKRRRRAVGIDLNPMAIFISEMTGRPADLNLLQRAFERIASEVQADIESLYQTECSRCERPAKILASVWDRDENELVDVRYSCEYCRRRLRRRPTKRDIAYSKRVGKRPVKDWFPQDEFPQGITFNQGRREAGKYFSDLFTRRNLIALTLLWRAIEDLKPEAIRELMSFAFTSMVHLASKMTPVRPSRPFSSFWALNSYWVPPTFMESNVWMLFDSAINGRQGLRAAKEDSNSSIVLWKSGRSFRDLEKGATHLLKVHNTLELEEILPENSVDYVFTDPPYGGAVPYAELTTLWALWKGMKINYADEITINGEKNFDYYHRMLQAAFRQVFRVLKPGRFLTVTFHSTDIRVWNSIIGAVVLSGFDLEKIIYQPPARPSAKGLLVPYGSAVGDYYIRFKKPESGVSQVAKDVSEEQYEKAVLEAAKKILAERGEPTPYTYILNGIIVELRKAGALLAGRKNPDRIMRAHLDKDFILVDERDKFGKILGRKWWFKDPGSVPYLELIPLADRLETAVVGVLHRKVKVSFDDVLQDIFVSFPNSLTPETQKVKDLLEEYASQTSDGKWALKPIVYARESEHSRIIVALAELGKKAGYQVAIGQRELAEVFGGKKLATFTSKAALDLRSVPDIQAARIRQIDVIWFAGSKIEAIFEVENTTAITEAIVRGSNLAGVDIARYIVLPEERERLLHRKLQQPMLADRVRHDGWEFIFYKDLTELHEKKKKARTITLTDIESIASTPKMRGGQLGLFS